MCTTIQLTIRRLPDGWLAVDADLSSDASAAASTLAADEAVAIDPAALLALSADLEAYGRALAAALFAPPALRDAWLRARAYAAAGDLQLRLRLDLRATDLHTIRWETLRDPESDRPIALHSGCASCAASTAPT
jgi:hypothetical protein